MTDDDTLSEIEQQLQQNKLPPVHEWHPENESTIDIRICRDGSWLYQGSPIQRKAMVRLFSTVLRRDADQKYYLVTPVEKLAISVDDAPFVVTSLNCLSEEQSDAGEAQQTLVFTTNIGDRVIADRQHPITVEYQQAQADEAVTCSPEAGASGSADPGEPAPYVLVRDQLPALINRSVWHQMAELCVTRGDELGVYSAGMFFALWKGSIE